MYTFFLQSEAIQVAHMKETKQIIQYLKNSDLHSNETETKPNDGHLIMPATTTTTATATATASEHSHNDDDYNAQVDDAMSNNAFNEVYYSGR